MMGLFRSVQSKSRRARVARRVEQAHPVRSLIVLCTANRVRSPFAAAVLSRLLPQGVTVISRGILPGGEPCPVEAVEAARDFQVDLSAFVSTRLSPHELVRSDMVLAMEQRMVNELSGRFPSVTARVLLLGDFDPVGSSARDVFDPYMLPLSEHRIAYERITRCCTAVALSLSAHNSQ